MLFSSRLEKYLGIHVILASSITVFVIVGIMSLSLFLQEIESVNKFYSKSDAFWVVLLNIPSSIYQILPIALLIGVLLGIGSLSEKSEITAIRSAGINKIWFVKQSLKLSIFISIIFVIISQIGIPEAKQVVSQIKDQPGVKKQTFQTNQIGWYRDGESFVNVGSIDSSGNIKNIKMYEFSDSKFEKRIYASNAQFDSKNEFWILQNIEVLTLEKNKMIYKNLDSLNWHTNITPVFLKLTLTPPADLSLSDLKKYIDFQVSQGVQVAAQKLVFWQKLLLPFSVSSLVLIGLSFVLQNQRNVSMGSRVVTGVLIGFVFKYVQELLGPISQLFGINPLIAALIPIVISFAIAFWLLSRVR